MRHYTCNTNILLFNSPYADRPEGSHNFVLFSIQTFGTVRNIIYLTLIRGERCKEIIYLLTSMFLIVDLSRSIG